MTFQTSEFKQITAPQPFLLLAPVASGTIAKCTGCHGEGQRWPTSRFDGNWGTCYICAGCGYVYRDTGESAVEAIIDGSFSAQQLRDAPIYVKPPYESPYRPGDHVALIHDGNGLKAGAIGMVLRIEETVSFRQPMLYIQFPGRSLQIAPCYIEAPKSGNILTIPVVTPSKCLPLAVAS